LNGVSGARLPFFLDAGSDRAGQRFCLYHAPRGAVVRGAIVYVHPLAEEMNKSRRMAALQSGQLAAAGFAVLQIDLLGCGDSSGEFEDATWDDWVRDVYLAVAWLRGQHQAPLWLWGLRAGCLLAAEAASGIHEPLRKLFWQPSTSGKLVLQQFLRLKTAAAALDGTPLDARKNPRDNLAAGRAVDVGGYRLSPRLAQSLEQAVLTPASRVIQAVWLEASTSQDAALLPATQRALQAWNAAGATVQARTVVGPAFWQTQEIEGAHELLTPTLASMTGMGTPQ
jgi:exosortase A-associated hydrolase 2